MSYQSAAEHPTYTSLDRIWPMQLEFNHDGKPMKLLIKDAFAPFAEAVYRVYNRISDIAFVDEKINLSDKIPLLDVTEMMEGFDGVSVFVARLLISAVVWAVKRGIELSRFKLHTGGMLKKGGIGWTPMGGVIYREVSS